MPVRIEAEVVIGEHGISLRDVRCGAVCRGGTIYLTIPKVIQSRSDVQRLLLAAKENGNGAISGQKLVAKLLVSLQYENRMTASGRLAKEKSLWRVQLLRVLSTAERPN